MLCHSVPIPLSAGGLNVGTVLKGSSPGHSFQILNRAGQKWELLELVSAEVGPGFTGVSVVSLHPAALGSQIHDPDADQTAWSTRVPRSRANRGGVGPWAGRTERLTPSAFTPAAVSAAQGGVAGCGRTVSLRNPPITPPVGSV
ncbi:hypothetical protein AAFF_G00015350 [Aldrovandia affinis]|uniref:Uncharacterized protein n=1 Tax=Aldrovandia affinis TaxID=143900 RepID=A0AAD7S6M0_9TELE|nr:hypothetical protein AAFF_G00015350 [Aldrovandia affinis]